MAQVGRISGPLLEANLLRQGIANNTQQNLSFKNTNPDTTLLKIDVANGRVGVDLEAPANELHVSDTLQTVDLIGDTANIANFNMSTNNISVDSGNIYLNAGEYIKLSNLETEQFYASDNYISTKDTNANIDLVAHGTGTVEVQSNLNVFGDIFASGDITLDGNIIFGDTGDDSTALTDTVSINADITSDLLPDVSDTYSVGNQSKQYDKIHTHFINGQLVNSGLVTVNSIAIELRPGNIFYVSKNGDNTNVGDHPLGSLASIEEALSRADASSEGPVTIKLAPGVYEENLPLVVPNRVSIIGTDIRNCVIKPAAGSESKDIFHLDDSTLISDVTIKDFQYDSGNNTGYAFRFAPGAVITNRSPYIQNVTVITSGSVTSASDPRGFDEGDAGKGAWIDGAELDSASVEASMLFHSATFITPGVDAITMTNGVRVEWLNSFTYFANRGLYALNGVTGRTSYDGSTVKYGAEVRSIGSANVYGNYGAVADGADTLMYLIQHNMAYIGAGKFVDNDASRAIYNNEITELNSGVIHYSTTDHLGGFRIGDNFWVDFETGNTTINIDTLTVNQFNALRVNTGNSTTVIDGAYIETGNLTVVDNIIRSNSGDVNIASGSGTINLQDNTNITGNLDITGNFTYDGTLNIKGDEATDSLTFNTFLDQDFNPHQHQTFKLGSFEKKWLTAHLNRLETPDIKVYDNVIETKTSNADLELRSAGTGLVRITNSATFSNSLTVNGTSTIDDDVAFDNTLPVTGDITQTGNYTLSNNATIDQNLTVNANASFEEILIDSNFITTTTSNTDLELRAAGTGAVVLQENVNVTNNLSADNISAVNANITLNTISDNANISDVEINDNYIETTSLNGDLNLVSDQNIFVRDTSVIVEQDLTVNSTTTLNSDLNFTGTITKTGNTTQTGNVTLLGEWTNGNIYVEDNFITTTESNSDLELRASGTGEVLIPNNNVQINNNLTVSADIDLQGTTITGTLTHVGDTAHDYTTLGNITDSATMNGTARVDGSSNFYLLNGTALIDYFYPPNLISIVIGNDITVNPTGYIMFTFDDGQRVILKLTPYTAPSYIPPAGMQRFEIDEYIYFAGSDSYQPPAPVPPLEVVFYQGKTAQVQVSSSFRNAEFTLNGELTVDNVYVEDNFITTTSGNLTLGATGDINVDINDVDITQDLTVGGATSLQGTAITGTVTHTGDRTQIGNLDIAGEISNGNILIEDNFISTTNSNSDLELRASGTGEVVIDPSDTVTIDNNLFVGGTLDYQGALTINGNVTLLGNVQDGSLTVTNNFDVTGKLDISSQAQFENVRIEDNFITTTQSNSNFELRANGTGEVLIPNNNVQVNNNLFTASISTGNITVNNDLVLDELVITDSNIEINENYITTKTSNANLELRASGTGIVIIPENTIAEQELTVNGTTNLLNTTINGNLTQTGNRTQTGTYTLTGNLIIGTLVTDEDVNFGDIEVAGNIFQTTLSNSNLEFRASDGNVRFDSDVQIDNNLTVNNITVDSITAINDVGLEIVELSTDIQFEDNYITTTNSNSNLELRAVGTGSVYLQDIEVVDGSLNTTATPDSTLTDITFVPNENINIDATNALQLPIGNSTDRKNITGDIRFNNFDNIFEATGSTGSTVSLEGVFSSNRLTSVTVDPNSNNIRFIVNGAANILDSTTLVGEVTGNEITLHGLSTDNILIDNNIITTNQSNADLELRTNGTGELDLGDIKLKNSSIKNNGNNLIIKHTDYGHAKLSGTYGFVIPTGGTINPTPAPLIGDTRWNTSDGQMETWDGTQYVVATGTSGAISQSEFDDLLLEYTIIFG